MESPWREHFRGSGCEGEGWRRRPLEWVLAIFGTGRGCRQPGRDPWAQQVGKKMGTGSVESGGVKSLTRGQGRDSFWKPEKVVPPTHEAPSLSNVTLFPPRLPPQPGAWPRPHRTRWRRRQSAPLRRRKAGAEAAAEANRGNLAQATTAHALTSTSEGQGTPRTAAHEVPSRPPVPERPAGPLLRSLPEPLWDPPLRSDPASANATQFEPAEGGGVLGHALLRPREWTSRGR